MRLPAGGRIDRSRSLTFTVDGVTRAGYPGDTLASALLANGVRQVGPSVYLGRSRGIVAAGVEEPNALVQVGAETMAQATTVELVDGLVAETLSGRGRLAEPDTGRYDKQHTHCDVLVVGGGPAGLAAAVAAGRSGGRVILANEQTELGGSLLSTPDAVTIPVFSGETRVLTRATVFGYYDHNHLTIAQRRPGGGRLWHVRAKRVVLATGAHERPLVFADNDRPGVMLASAVRTYLNRYGVLAGRRVVVCTTNDSAYATALDLLRAGAEVLVADTRRNPPAVAADVRGLGGEVRSAVIVGAEGDPEVTAAQLSDGTTVHCDLIAVSGGWNPAVHLHSQAGGTLRYDERLAAFVPEKARQAHVSVGSAAGEIDDAEPLWTVQAPDGRWDNHFVDLQRDATVADVLRATGAGMRSAEHVKRYTTIGTAHDQGKTAGVSTLGVIAQALGVTPGPTTFRPPYTPVSFALLAGRDRGDLHDPARVTPLHDWHVGRGARFEDVGQWKRPWYYPRAGEDMDTAVLRECRAARTGVAMMDASTLGKIEIVGPDAPEFLNRMYTNAFVKLPVGAARYGMLCKPDGMVFDDGVVLRLAEDRYLATTTTGNAAAVLDWFEEWLQTEWPDLRVYCTSVTEQWSTIAVVGPLSRQVVAAVAGDTAVDLAFMTFVDTTLRTGVAARIARISFSGELAYEVNVSGWDARATWDALYAAGEEHGITPYGTETMHVLRAEKGYPIIGQDTDGTVTPIDLGMDWIVSKRKDFVGKRSLRRPDTARPDRKQLVGLLPVDPDALLPEGAQLVADGVPLTPPVPMLGHVTSSYRSAALGRTFALALLRGGRDRLGQVVQAPLSDRTIAATVTEPIFYDPEGKRRDG